MAETAADILAGALEREADAHDAGEFSNTEARMEAVRRKVASFNDIPRPVYKLAMKFWKAWAREARFNWNHFEPMSKGDWPRMARTIAQSVRTGHLPNDKAILENFVHRRPKLRWFEIKRLLGESKKS